jgi:hypothetical protein
MNPVAVPLRRGRSLLLGLALCAFVATDAAAQRVSEPRPELIRDVDGTVVQPPATSAFQLSGLADLAFAGMRSRGNMRFRLSNNAVNDYYGGPYGINWIQNGTPTGAGAQRLFQGSLGMVAPRTEYLKARDRLRAAGIESLSNVTGGGYNRLRNITHFSLFQPEQWLPADDQLGFVHSGQQATADGTCTDFQLDQVAAGFALMAVSDCEPTWGAERFEGATRAITLDQWMRYFNDVGAENFSWDWWRVPAEYQTDLLLGDFQAYGKIVDWGLERRARMGSVMPGGAGPPTEQGWPMGISIYFDAFTFELPTLTNTVFWQALVVNESERVWGIPLDYDSLYLGMVPGVVMGGQGAAQYFRPDIGGVIVHGNGEFAGCNGARAPTGVPGCRSGLSAQRGDAQGTFAMIFLNSPLGDLRNKEFTRDGSPFFAPNHPNAGDTITFNIGRMCGFGTACWNSIWDRSARSSYGYVAGSLPDLLDGRTEAEFDGISTAAWFYTFRNHDFPVRTPRWNQMVVEGWDWQRNGANDTISVPTCLGPEFGGPVAGYPCSALFSDTLPGKLNNSWSNIGGFFGFGPIRLAAGDTTKFTLAMISGANTADFMARMNATLGFYRAGYLRLAAPPAPNVVAVNVTPGDRGRAPGASVRIYLDDAPEAFVDDFLLFQAEQLEGTDLAIDNPWLVDSLRAVAVNNLAALRVYKSCNAGRNFTGTANCFGDPTLDEDGTPVGLGWRYYRRFEASATGQVPNVFTDGNVTAGQRYLYVFLAESRGFEVNVLVRNPDTGALVPGVLSLAPMLTNPLSLSVSDPNVVSVYVPASRQAGAQPATVDFAVDDPRAPAATHQVFVTLTGDEVPAGTYRMVFGDSVIVRRTDAPVHGAGGAVVGRNVRTEVTVHRTVLTSPDGTATPVRQAYQTETYVYEGEAGVTLSGGATSVQRTGHAPVPGDTTVVTTTVYGNVLTMVVLDEANRPLLVSSTLTGGAATPGTFFGRPDFPGFFLNVGPTTAGTFIETVWTEVQADTLAVLRARGSPSINWQSTLAGTTQHGFGEYRVNFLAPEFGPARLFTLNLANPAQTQQAFTQSLNQRTGQTTVVSEDVAAAIRASGGTGLANTQVEDLIAVSVPFTVRNATTGNDVIIAMLKESKRDSILVGSGVNTMWLRVPPDRWVPGEPLLFLERVTRFRQARTPGGQVYTVTGPDGQPVVHDSLMVTFSSAVVGCESPVTCQPLVHGTPGAPTTGHLNAQPGRDILRVRYRNPLTARTQYTFTITPALTGEQVTALAARDLQEIKVIPNPYIVFSTFEQALGDRRLMFAGLPPRGTVQIFTVAGQFVQRITYSEADLAGNGDLFWNMRTFEDNDIATGLYLFVVDGELPASGQRVRKTGKFVVVRGS